MSASVVFSMMRAMITSIDRASNCGRCTVPLSGITSGVRSSWPTTGVAPAMSPRKATSIIIASVPSAPTLPPERITS